MQQDQRQFDHDNILSDIAATVLDMTIKFGDLATARLLLRQVRETDRQAVVEIQTDPEANRFHPEPPDEQAAVKELGNWLEHWTEYGYGYVAVLEAGSDEIIGIGGIRHRRFHGRRVLNLYYRFRPSAWGKGYALETARAIVDWAERELPEFPVVISAAEVNEPSWRLAERLGFTDYVVEPYAGLMTRHYRR
ncbi:Protein N-acetyltransferase, RimJ/RimL family [Amycolatopsis xylanica]|uniref:Protein N-acetyltransferase, RimJ/RimL family n=2 Tax=Amycolatopsis xylanica TaxID=589385 RepID=A0A1H3DK47_9PSEU|nr:Protein N-acetyltransferase, RimJ/RimL family [Amycolatopsis xylanica]